MRRTMIALLAGTALLAGCSETTAPHPIAATVREVSFASEAERLAWPNTPSVEGGTQIRIRGTAYVGCGGIAADAVDRGGRIDVAVRAANADAICLAIVAPNPAYEVTLTGVPAGQHVVRVTVAGYEGAAEWVVTVSELVPLD